MSFFDTFLQKVDPADKAVLDKYPDLRSSVETMERDLNQTAKFAAGWVDWQSKNWDNDAGATRKEVALQQELEAAQARLATATAAGSGASATEIAKLRTDLDAKLADIDKRSQNAVNGMNMFYRSISNKILTHHQEFGEVLDSQKVIDFMEANKIQDPDVAYDKMVAGRRAEIATENQKKLDEKHAADLEAARKEGYDKHAQEISMGPGGALPTDQTGGIAGITAAVQSPAKISDETKTKIAEAKGGDGTLAALGYEMYRRGDFSQTQQ